MSKYEIKLEKLTFARILIVFLCEILFEFSFGLVFFIFSEYNEYNGENCMNLLYWAQNIWKLYLVEFSIAFVCFLIGITSLCCYKKILTKVYISFNNFFKGLIFIASITILSIMTIVYNEGEECTKLGELTFIWLIFHYTLLAFAFIAALTILIVTLLFFEKAKIKQDTDLYVYFFKDYVT